MYKERDVLLSLHNGLFIKAKRTAIYSPLHVCVFILVYLYCEMFACKTVNAYFSIMYILALCIDITSYL